MRAPIPATPDRPPPTSRTCWPASSGRSSDEPLRSTLPPVFDGVQPSPGVGYDDPILEPRGFAPVEAGPQYGGDRKAGLRHAEAGAAGNPNR